MSETEHERRLTAALAAIADASGTEAGADSVDLFIEHHVEELPPAYWQQHLGTTAPTAQAVIGLLVLRSSWGRDDLEHFDFTLPGDVTDYVVTVRFDQHGAVSGVDMES